MSLHILKLFLIISYPTIEKPVMQGYQSAIAILKKVIKKYHLYWAVSSLIICRYKRKVCRQVKLRGGAFIVVKSDYLRAFPALRTYGKSTLFGAQKKVMGQALLLISI